MRKSLLVLALLAFLALPMASWADTVLTNLCSTASSGSISTTWCYDTNISASGAGTITLNTVYLNGDTNNTGQVKVVALDGAGTITSIAGFTLGNPDCTSNPFNAAPFTSCFGANNGGGGKVDTPFVINVTGVTSDTTLAFHFLSFANNSQCSVKVDATLGSSNGTYLTAPVVDNCSTTQTPEPASLALLGVGLLSLGGLFKRRK